MSKGNDWVKFLREQYPEESRIRLRELENPHPMLPTKSMGTLVRIDDNGGFHVKWDKGMYSVLNPGRDSFKVLEPELTTIKLYMPLCGVKRGDNGCNKYGPMEQSEMLRYQDAIRSAMMEYRSPEETERGIMYWFDGDDDIDRKVKAVFFTAEERRQQLWGVAECRIAGELKADELLTLKEHISAQASDGWGERFEQQKISAGDDELYVYLWGSEDWDIKTEEEQFPLKLAEGLPDLCFSTLASTGELICIKRGESGYYLSEWNTDDPTENKELAELNNQYLGVTDAQRQAMEVGSMVGWEVPGADPAAYENSGMQRNSGEAGIHAPLLRKLEADYTAYNAQWQREYEAVQGDLPMETLEEMAVVNTVYGNLQNMAADYPTEYMAALSKEPHPLSRLAETYKKAGIFAIEPRVNDMLCMIADYDANLTHFGEFDTAYITAGNHRERMAVLDRNLDGQISEYNGQALRTMGFRTVKERAVEIFTQRQLYQSLRFEKDQYPAEKLDVLSGFKNPMNLNGVPIVGERNLCQRTMDEVQKLLPQMYPDITAAPDIWSSNEPQELCDEETWEYPDQENVTDIQMGGMM